MSQLVAVVGPSGAGKDLLMAMAIAARPDWRAARRVITRPTDAGGEDFTGVSEDEFAQRQARGEFALHWRAHGLGYAIPADQLVRDGTVLFNASRAVLGQAARLFPGLRIILITAPAQVLAKRLAARGRETETDQQQRLKRADFAMPEGVTWQTVINDSTADIGLARFLAALDPPPSVANAGVTDTAPEPKHR